MVSLLSVVSVVPFGLNAIVSTGPMWPVRGSPICWPVATSHSSTNSAGVAGEDGGPRAGGGVQHRQAGLGGAVEAPSLDAEQLGDGGADAAEDLAFEDQLAGGRDVALADGLLAGPDRQYRGRRQADD